MICACDPQAWPKFEKNILYFVTCFVDMQPNRRQSQSSGIFCNIISSSCLASMLGSASSSNTQTNGQSNAYAILTMASCEIVQFIICEVFMNPAFLYISFLYCAPFTSLGNGLFKPAYSNLCLKMAYCLSFMLMTNECSSNSGNVNFIFQIRICLDIFSKTQPIRLFSCFRNLHTVQCR